MLNSGEVIFIFHNKMRGKKNVFGDLQAMRTFYSTSYLDQVVCEPKDPSHVQKTVKQMQCLAVHPAFGQHRLELLAEGHVNGVFGRKQVPVGDGLLAVHWWTQSCACLLEDVGTHALHDGTHNDHSGESAWKQRRERHW